MKVAVTAVLTIGEDQEMSEAQPISPAVSKC